MGGLALLASSSLSQVSVAQDFTSVDASTEGGCVQIHLRTRDALSFAGSKLSGLTGKGDMISFPVEILGGATAQTDSSKTAQVEADNPAGLVSVSLARNTATDGLISLGLSQPMRYRIVMDAETRHIRVDVAKANDPTGCNAGQVSVASVSQQAPAGPLAQANTAIAAGRYEEALKILIPLTGPLTASLAGNDKQKAMELNGLALERLGRFGEAKVQYEAVLALFPAHESNGRIRQRIADVIDAMKVVPIDDTAKGDLPRELQAAPSDKTNESLADNSGALRGTIAPESTLRSMRKIRDPIVDPEAWVWTKYGTAGQAYYRDDQLGDDHELVESEVISTVSVGVKGENQQRVVTMRVDALNRQDVGINDNGRRNSISTFYADILDKPSRVSARLGRQVRNDGGIFGRFDGVSAGFKAHRNLDLAVAVGSPVYDRGALPFEDDRYFFSASGIYALPDSAWSGELYFIEQRAGSIVDRRAIGTELRYQTDDLAAYTGVDYDINQDKVSSAFISGNWQANDRLVLSASLDYRTQPFLLTSNALTGQEQDKLPSLVNLLGEKQVLVLADDRTADAVTAALGISYTFSDRWQMSFDVLWSDVSGMPASGGVDEIPELAKDIFASAYLNGSGILRVEDVLGLGITYTHGENRSKIGADISWRLPVDDTLRINTRLRASVTTGSGDALYSITPSIGARYRINKHWLLESEFGVTLHNGEMPAELQAFAGYRYEF
jgi:tetratricopeptide (TPR) repeat protein